MGDRYEIEGKCVYCGENQEDLIYYAPTCGFLTFECDNCKRENFITTEFKIKKVEDVTYDEVEEAISHSSNFLNEEQIKKVSKDFFKKLIKHIPKTHDFNRNPNIQRGERNTTSN